MSVMSSTEYWDKRRQTVFTNIGKWTGGEGVNVRGHSLFKDLFHQCSYMQLVVLNATGKMVSKALSTWLETNLMALSYPDARIWCNHVGALAGSMQTSPTAATTAGTLAADSRVYGCQSTRYTMEFLQSKLKEFQSGKTVTAIVSEAPIKNKRPAIMGFARPIVRNDERIEPHRKMTAELGFPVGEHMQLANEISDYLEAHFQMGINIGGYTAAFLLDQGFTPEEQYRMRNMCVASGVTACYTEYYDLPEQSLLPQQCDDVEYQGAAIRTLDD